MAEGDEQLEAVLAGYAKFLQDRELALPSHQPYLVRWVRQFLHFAREHAGYTFEQALDLFLAEVGGRAGTDPWQVQQAADAVRIYRYQYRGAAPSGQSAQGPLTSVSDLAADTTLLARLREVIRLRHLARSTEKSYLHWSRRFLAYRQLTGVTGKPTAEDVKTLLTRLAMVEHVSASTQNQAFSALLLLFREVLRTDMKEMEHTIRAKRGRRLPTVLSVAEVQALLAAVAPEHRLMAKLLYGSGCG